MPKFMRKTTILAKVETTAGTDAIPTGGANAILVRNVNCTPLELNVAERNIVRGFFGNFDGLPTSRKMKLSFEVEAASSGTAGSAAAWAPLMLACGTTETLTAVTKADYAPNSANTTTLSMYVNIDGVMHKMLYARGNCSFKLKANDIPVFAFDFIALDGGIADVAAPTPVYTAFQTPLPATKTNTPTFSLHGVATLAVESLDINFGNQIEQITRIGAESIQQTDRKTTGTVMFEMTSIATKDWFATIRASTDAALSLIHGTVAGQIIEVAAPTVELMTPVYSDVQGIQMLQLSLRFLPSNSGNDEFKFTAR